MIENIIRFYRKNLLFIFAFGLALFFYLAEIQVIESWLYKEPTNHLVSTIKFCGWLMVIVLVYQLNKNRQTIIDKLYDAYEKNEVYEDTLYSNPLKFNQKAIEYISRISNGFLNTTTYKPLEYYGNDKYQDILRHEQLKVTPSKPYNLVISLTITAGLISLLWKVDFTKNEGLFSVYALALLTLLILCFHLYNIIKTPVLFEFSKSGLKTNSNVIYPWKDIEFGYIAIDRSTALYIKVINKEKPIRVHIELGTMKYGKKAICHSFEYFHRKYGQEE